MTKNFQTFQECNAQRNMMLHDIFVLIVAAAGPNESVISVVVSTQSQSPTLQPFFVEDNNIGIYLVNESITVRSTLIATTLYRECSKC